MVIRSSTAGMMTLACAASLLAGCASNGQQSQEAQNDQQAKPQPAAAKTQSMSPVIPAGWDTPAATTAEAASSLPAAAQPAEASPSVSAVEAAVEETPAVKDMTEVDIYLRGPDFRYARWHVESDGTLRFAGDRFARSSEWGWTGQVTFAQSQSINAIASRWVSARPKGDDSNGEVWEVQVQGADGRTRFTVHGTASSVAEMWSIFNTAGKGHRHAQADPVPPRDLDSLFFKKPAQVEAGDE